MNHPKAIRIDTVKFTGGHRLAIQWLDGTVSEVDLSAMITRYKGLRPLQASALFAAAAVGEGGHCVVWPGDIDVGADTLWVMHLEQNGHSDAAEFQRWRWRNGLSLAQAAAALGLSRRMVAYYTSGARAVPRTVLLACKGWEREREQTAAA